MIERPVRGGGLTPEVLLFSALLVLPALWRTVVVGDLPLTVTVERYIFIAIGCAIVSTLVHAYSESARVVGDRLDRLDRPDGVDAPRVPTVEVEARPIGYPGSTGDVDPIAYPELPELPALDDTLFDEGLGDTLLLDGAMPADEPLSPFATTLETPDSTKPSVSLFDD